MFLFLLPIAVGIFSILASVHALRQHAPQVIEHTDGSGIILIVGIVAVILMHLMQKNNE